MIGSIGKIQENLLAPDMLGQWLLTAGKYLKRCLFGALMLSKNVSMEGWGSSNWDTETRSKRNSLAELKNSKHH